MSHVDVGGPATINLPGSAGYLRATKPHNSIANQRPRGVAEVVDDNSASAAVQYASAAGLRVAIQATGHGVAGDLGDDTLLADTSGLDHVVVKPQDRTARVPLSRPDAPRSKRRASRAINHKSVPKSCSRGFFATP